MSIEERNQHVTGEIEKMIVNNLGINLCSVEGVEIDRQKDGQIKNINIKFIPDPIE